MAQAEQVSCAREPALQRAVSVVYMRRSLHRGSALGVAGVHEFVRMDPGLELPVCLFQFGRVETKSWLQAEQLEVILP
jgi:hypothetical protein